MKKRLLGLVGMSFLSFLTRVSLGATGGCGGDGKTAGNQLFTPKPECTGDPVRPYAGTFPQVIRTLAIGGIQDGFDLDGDGKPDNKLAAVGTLAADAISNALANYEVIIPLEYFDLPTVAPDTCVKFAIYEGSFDKDRDGDGKRPGIAGGDCDDTATGSGNNPGATEIPGDGIDNNCNGLADEDGTTASTNTDDADHDGHTIAAGDCNDHDPDIYKGHPEICGDGKDNDCDGVADRSVDGSGNVTACSPFDKADVTLDPLSFAGSAPLVAFTDGTIDSSMKLVAGPGVFSVDIPVTSSITLTLKITGATIEGTIGADGALTNGRLGGVIDAKTADTIRGLDVAQIGLTPQDSLLDAIFANALGPLLVLPKAKADIVAKYPNCRTPDIDVDGDGLEAFCDSTAGTDHDAQTVDTCIDGDGTVITDTLNPDGSVAQHCTEALDHEGHPRFVDGVSVELNLTTVPVNKLLMP